MKLGKVRAERARLPVLLLSMLAERPMHGYEINQQIRARAIRQWANIGLSSIYQALETLVKEGFSQAKEVANTGQGASYRTVYTITAEGRGQLEQLARSALSSTDHQRFDYDLGLGVSLAHLPALEVRNALVKRREALQAQFVRVSDACKWAEDMLGAWVVLDHQRRALAMELEWLEVVIKRLEG